MQNVQVNTKEIAGKLYEMLKASGWHNILKGFMLSEDFDKIILTLQEQVNDNKRFTPPLKQVFRAFQECPVDNTKVVIIGQDPYPQLNVADGLAFSCGNTMKKEASLRYIHKAIVDTVYNNTKDVKDLSPDLTPWAHQGVLLLNTSLTTEIGKIGKHFNIWQPFTNYVLDMLNAREDSLVWVFLGKKAQEYAELIGDHHHKIFASHPASAAYQHQQQWDCNDVFNKVNETLKQIDKEPIKW